jgi:hypothetical protein
LSELKLLGMMWQAAGHALAVVFVHQVACDHARLRSARASEVKEHNNNTISVTSRALTAGASSQAQYPFT